MRRDYLWLALLLAAVAALPQVIHSDYYLTVLVVIGINLILVLGLNLVMGYAGQISLGHAGFFGLGAYLSMILTSTQTPLEDWLKSSAWTPEFLVLAGGALHRFTAGNMVIAAALAAALTGAVAWLVGTPTLKLRGHYLAMATLGLGIIIQIVFKEESLLTGGPSGMGVPYLKVWGREIDPNTPAYYYLVWVVVVAAILLSIHLLHSRTGRALRAIHEDEMAAATSGVPVLRLKVMVFALSAVFASVAGSLYAHFLTHINPSPFGFMFSVKLVVMVVAGGMGSVWGAILGSALLTILPQLLTVLHDYETVTFAAILILVLMFAPSGLAGLFAAGLRRLREPAP